jgi:lysophospholipid acyltransferase (LPLAT)-like uncharacterized protein
MTTTTEERATARRSARTLILGSLLFWTAKLIRITLRVRSENPQRVEESIAAHHGAIFVLWHGRSLVPAFTYRHRGYWALIGLSRDGEIQDDIFRRLGYRTVRGATRRGGVRAALQLVKVVASGGVLVLAPDGPKGPTHQVHDGVVFVAQRSGRPIIPAGFSARPRVLLGFWDRYMVPIPFARATCVYGEPILVPADLDDAGRRRFAKEVERAINRCEKRAEELLGLTYPPEFPT